MIYFSQLHDSSYIQLPLMKKCCIIFAFPEASNEIHYLDMENLVLEENKIVCEITTSRSKITECISFIGHLL